MTEAEWLGCDDPDRLQRWLAIGGPDISDNQTEAMIRHGLLRVVEPSEFGAMTHLTPILGMVGVERQRQLRLLRDIFGPLLFRLVTLDPTWLTPTVKLLAALIYEEHQYDKMPVLGDALEEAGCDNEDVLKHCRGGGIHVQGCWVVDLLLGKE